MLEHTKLLAFSFQAFDVFAVSCAQNGQQVVFAGIAIMVDFNPRSLSHVPYDNGRKLEYA